MEIEFLAGLLACNFELAQQGLLVYADAHGGEFDGAAERGIPYQDVTVESLAAVAVGRRPVVVVGRAAVVRLSVGELAAYTYYKYGSILLAYQIFAFLDALTSGSRVCAARGLSRPPSPTGLRTASAGCQAPRRRVWRSCRHRRRSPAPPYSRPG